ncbi:hypothetical protein AAFF_G00250960 [Aldrovandia affinis]|uniref:Uncharacterized protein n=1 Tax=Aldrovandia affinis TaxID=143900 RepID=A0AAD7RFK3_9TELE|nr:hypothetical protein AAFF_G00250960 [Aldrovandia affinis]
MSGHVTRTEHGHSPSISRHSPVEAERLKQAFGPTNQRLGAGSGPCYGESGWAVLISERASRVTALWDCPSLTPVGQLSESPHASLGVPTCYAPPRENHDEDEDGR